MKVLFASCAAVAAFGLFSFSNLKPSVANHQKAEPKKIQVAILLDVSNSMDGLIEQAKAQLWNMVTTLGKAQCTDKSVPNVEVALYEYGRSSNDVTKGYVKQLSTFTQDLDSVSKILFGLTTNGGDEYCGQVIYTSIDELKWNAAKDEYKVIFIAGNEDFLQGNMLYTTACAKAKEKGVIVNTIYCGDRMQGIKEHWNLLNECGNGSFTNINTDAREIEIPTPYDSTLIVLNYKLNGTYIGYGSMGLANSIRQQEVDKMNFSASNGAGLQRVNAKAMSNAYNNASWDLVDAVQADSSYISKVDRKTLPDSLKNKTTKELRLYVQQKTAERNAIQQQIINTNADRSKYIAAEKAKAAANNNGQTLESAVETAIREQVKRFNMQIPKE
ncbi:MAG: VWA domain-containing protein [Sphingobacteriales bacterium]|nr:VWA domain-containing protein [Sphingobacteriales bacterium]